MATTARSSNVVPQICTRPHHWPVIVGGLAIMAVSHVVLWASLWHMTQLGYGDFSAFYCAGKIVGQGDARDLYNLERQAAMRKQVVPEALIRGAGLPFFHPAYEALIYAALANLPYKTAYLLWNLAGLAILLAILYLLRKQLQPPLNSIMFLVVAALGYFPVAETFLHGQDDMLLWLLLTLAYVSLASGRDGVAGMVLSLGLFKFHLVMPIVAVLLFQRRWRLGQGFAAGGTAMALLSIATTGHEGALQYTRLMLHLDSMPQDYIAAYTAVMPNLRGALTSIASIWVPQPGGVLRATILLLSAALVIYAGTSVAKKENRSDVKLSYSIAVVTAVLVSYHANIYDLTLLSFPLLFLTERLWSSAEAIPLGESLLIVLLAFSPVYHLLLVQRSTHLLFWPVLALLPVIVKCLRFRPRGPESVQVMRQLTPPGASIPSS